MGVRYLCGRNLSASLLTGWSSCAGGGPQAKAHLLLELDGYSAPLTAGNFVTKVLDGAVAGRRLDVNYTSVLSESDSNGALWAGQPIPNGL